MQNPMHIAVNVKHDGTYTWVTATARFTYTEPGGGHTAEWTIRGDSESLASDALEARKRAVSALRSVATAMDD